MLKRILTATVFFVVVTCAAGCLGPDSVSVDPQLLAVPAVASASLDQVRGRKVEDLTLVVFTQDIKRDKWKEIFRKNNELDKLKQEQAHVLDEIDELESKPDPTDDERQKIDDFYAVKSKLLERITSLLSYITSKTAFMMNWTTDHRCSFNDADAPLLKCKARPGNPQDVPMDGGIPEPEAPAEVVGPGGGEREKTNWIQLRLKSVMPDYGKFRFRLRLRPELASPDASVLKGEAVIEDGSYFVDLKTGAQRPHYKYAYVEMRLKRR